MLSRKIANAILARFVGVRGWIYLGIIAVATLAESGCRLPSVGPFFCKENVIPTPKELLGRWVSDDLNLLFESDRAVLSPRQPKSEPTELYPVFFKIGDNVFLDVALTHGPDSVEYPTSFFLIPCHILFKLDLKSDAFTATAFNYQWIAEQVDQHKIEIPHVVMRNPKKDSDFAYLFTATPEQWVAVLKKCVSTPEAFQGDVKFKRVVDEKEKSAP